MTQSKPTESELHDLKIVRKKRYIVIEKIERKSRSFLSDSIYPVESIEKE
jgi:hypothetical protein